MNAENAIEVRDITKSFKVYLDKGNELKERMLFWKRNRFEERMVLRGISFDVKKGEAIGLIGHNGCGKSTTLKMLSKILYPDSGTIEMCGRVSSLIELGAGFHPDMSGRENIYTNASIFGLNKKEIDERLEDIIVFSELEDFIDNPVRTYSSGMYMRLAFSVAINVDADILLIDEILAVGDANFQAKCFDRLREIKAAGTTIVIVSHSLGQIEQICERSLWIHEGQIRKEGSPRDVHPEYLDYMGAERERIAAKEAERKRKIEMLKNKGKVQSEQGQSKAPDGKEEKQKFQEEGRYGKREIEVVSVAMFDEAGNEKAAFRTGDIIDIVVKYRKNQEVDSVIFGFGIFKNDGTHCYGTNTMLERIGNLKLQEEGELHIRIPYNPLLGGTYDLQVGFHSDHGFYYDYIKAAKTFQSTPYYGDIGITRINHEWEIDGTIFPVDDIHTKEKEVLLIPEMTQEEIEQKKRTSRDAFFTDHGFYPPDVASNEANQWMRLSEGMVYIRNKQMDLQLLISGGRPEGGQSLVISKDDTTLTSIEECDKEEFEVIIPREELGDEDWLDLKFVTNLTWSRTAVTNGDDNREVGIYLRDVRWTHALSQVLNAEGLLTLIKPAVDEIPRDLMPPIYLRIENRSTGGQVLSSLGIYPVKLAYRIIDMDGRVCVDEGERNLLPDVLCPGDSEMMTLHYDLSMLDPQKDYWMIITLVQEGAFWFVDFNPDNATEMFLPKAEKK